MSDSPEATTQVQTEEVTQERLRTEMRFLMDDMQREGDQIGPYFHRLEYTDPKTSETKPVFFLRQSGVGPGDIRTDAKGHPVVSRAYGVYVTENGIKLCSSPSHGKVEAAINNGQSDEVKRLLHIAMTDNVGPYNENLMGAVRDAFETSRKSYLERKGTSIASAQNSVSIAAGIRGMISSQQ